MSRSSHATWTDTLIPEHLLEKIEKKSDVLIAPTIPYGSCQCLAPYPGTIDIDGEVLYQFCRQIFLSLYRHGARIRFPERAWRKHQDD